MVNPKIVADLADGSRVVGTLVSYEHKFEPTNPPGLLFSAKFSGTEVSRIQVDSDTLGLLTVDAKYITQADIAGTIVKGEPPAPAIIMKAIAKCFLDLHQKGLECPNRFE